MCNKFILVPTNLLTWLVYVKAKDLHVILALFAMFADLNCFLFVSMFVDYSHTNFQIRKPLLMYLIILIKNILRNELISSLSIPKLSSNLHFIKLTIQWTNRLFQILCLYKCGGCISLVKLFTTNAQWNLSIS